MLNEQEQEQIELLYLIRNLSKYQWIGKICYLFVSRNLENLEKFGEFSPQLNFKFLESDFSDLKDDVMDYSSNIKILQAN